MRRTLCLILVLCMLAAQLPVFAMAEEAETGYFGSGLHIWDSDNSDSWTKANLPRWSASGDFGAATAYSNGATAAAAEADSITKLTVGGVNALRTSSGTGWRFNAGTATLTLDGFNYANHQGNYGIYCDGSLTIVLKGTNVIDTSVSNYGAGPAGIWVENGDLTIMGDPEAEESLEIYAGNTEAAIYTRNVLTIDNCDFVYGEAARIGIYGNGGLRINMSTVGGKTPGYDTYRTYNQAGMHPAIGSGVETRIVASTVSADAGLVGIMGPALWIESSTVETIADGWPIYAPSGVIAQTDCAITATNRSKQEDFADFFQWTGCPYFTAIFTDGGAMFTDAEVNASAQHFAVLVNNGDLSISQDSKITAAAGFSALASTTGMTIADSTVTANTTFSVSEAANYTDTTGMSVMFNGIYVLNEDAVLDISNSDITVSGGFCSIGASRIGIAGSSVDVRNSCVPILGGHKVTITDCASVYAETNGDMLKEQFSLLGQSQIFGAISGLEIQISNCENVTAKGLMAGVFATTGYTRITDSNVTAAGGAYGIAGAGLVIDSSYIQAEAFWTPEERTQWGNAPAYALFGANELTLVDAAPTNGETVVKNNSGYVLLDADWNYAASVTIVPSAEPEPTEPEPTDHTHTEEIIPGKAATCTETGLTEGRRCSVCGEVLVQQETIPVTGHTEEIIPGEEATCTEPGLTDITKCSVCGAILAEQTEIPAKGHNYWNGCCTRCGAEDPDASDPLEPGDAEIIASGEAASNLDWTLDAEGTLRIFATSEPDGSGDYSMNYYPATWSPYADQIIRVRMDNNVSSIGWEAFFDCVNLKDIVIGAGVKSIDKAAFANCDSLESIRIPGNVKSIGERAFLHCDNLERVEFEEGIQTLGKSMFYDCPKLMPVVLPEGIKSILDGLYLNSDFVTEITIPESVETIGEYAFSSLKKLPMITIPKNVTQIGGMAFLNTFSLTTVVFEGDAPEMQSPFYCASFNGVMFYPKDNPTWENIGDILWSSGGLMEAIPYTRDGQGNIIPETPDVTAVQNDISWFREQYYPTGTNYPDNYSYIINGNMLTGYGKEAFAFELSDACFGYLPISEKRAVSYDALQLGDILYTDSGVWVITELDASGVKAAGVDANNQVCYDLQMTKAEVSAADAYRTRYGVSPYAGEMDPAQDLPKIEGPDHVLTEAEVYEIIMAQQANFPEGMPYSSKNHYHRNVKYLVEENTSVSPDGHGCSAFAGILSDLAFGDLPPIYIPVGSVDYDSIMAGDLLEGPGHEVVVLEVHPDYVVVAEGNYDDGRGGRIHWGRQITREEIAADYALVTRYPEKMGGDHVHNWGNPTCTTPKTCPCGATSGSAYGHAVQVIQGKAATCTETGLTDGKCCTRCGEIIVAQEVIPELGHRDDGGEWIKGCTCTENGEILHTCTRCGYTYIQEIEAYGHSYDWGTITVEPTCTESGEKTYTCSRCGDFYTEEVEPNGHQFGVGVTITEPTCTETGESRTTCYTCGYSYTEEIKAHGHQYNVYEMIVEPTCTEKGEAVYICYYCAEQYTGEVEAQGHNYSFGYCTECGVEDPSEPVVYASGTCGTNVAWSLDSHGTFVIYGVSEPAAQVMRTAAVPLNNAGNFRMNDYARFDETPWAEYESMIARVQVDDLVTNIGSNAFWYCDNLKHISIGAGVAIIGERAFAECYNLETVLVGENVAEIQSQAFAGCETVTVTFSGDEPAVADSAFENATVTLNYPEGNVTWEDASENNYGENVTVQAHTHSYTSRITEATCLTDGYTTYTCDCGHKYKGDQMAATGHSFADGICTECGVKEITHTPGDINDDGKVNNKDLTRLFQYLSNWDVEVVEETLDVNGDGKVNNKDLTRLFQFLSNWDVEIF